MNLGFTNPWLLPGLLAVGLPVLIHYLTRARPRRIAFPPFKFLLEACAGQQSLHRLRTLLLLTLRTLAVLALALLFTRPFLKPTGASSTAEATKRVALILDASLSMRAVQHGVSLFARAQAEAADVLRGLESGSEAVVILGGASPRALLPALSRNIPALHEELVKASATFEFGDPGAALALAQKLLGNAGTIYVFSDFQQSNWMPTKELPAGLITRLRRVTTDPVDNVALTSVRLAPAEPVTGEPTEILCTVFNCTPQPRQETVRLELADLTQEARVTVAPFGSADAAFNVTFTRPGPFTGKASLAPDDLPEDSTRHIAVTVQKALQVLLVSDADAKDQRSAAWFVSRALAPSPESAPGFTLVRRHSADTDRGILETADVFVLVSPAQLAGEAIEIVQRRVNDGARFIAFLDGPTAPTLMAPALSPPFQLQRTVQSDPGDTLVAGPRKLFADADTADFSALRFRRHFQTQTVEGRSGDLLLLYPDQSAALSLSAVGKGSAVFANIPLTPDSGDLVGSPMFPAMLHELLRSLRRGAEERTVSPGNAWTLDAPTIGDTEVRVIGPDGKAVEAKVLSSGRITRLALPTVKIPGAYSARQGDTVVAIAAVNVDPRESDTRPLAVESLKPGAGALVSVVRDEDELLLAGRTRPLWPQLAAFAALMLALEMLLLAAWRRPISPSRREARVGRGVNPETDGPPLPGPLLPPREEREPARTSRGAPAEVRGATLSTTASHKPGATFEAPSK